MSEAQNNLCNNDYGDSDEIQNTLQENVDTPKTCHQSHSEQLPELAACRIVHASGGDSQNIEKDDNANTKESTESNNNDSTTVLQLQAEILKRTMERDDFRKRLEETERRLAALQSSESQVTNVSILPATDINLQRELEDLKGTLAQTKLVLDDRERRVVNQENQISALNKQVSSLKEVFSITKDMLNIRNLEVKHLQEEVDKMESKISIERERHTAMINKMDAAVRLNTDLKKEYQTQLQLFQDLKGIYQEKVTLLSEENKALETAVQAQPAQ